MITIPEYKQAEKELKKIRMEKDKQDEIFKKEEDVLWTKFHRLEKKLNNQKYKEENILTRRKEKFKTSIQAREKHHVEKRQEYERILTLMEIHKDEPDIKPIRVYYYDYPRDEKGEVKHIPDGHGNLVYPDKTEIPYEPIALLKNDKYAIIQAYITKNDKPKNKYTLSIVGRTIFKELLENQHTYGYGSDYRDEHANINIWLADRPTKEELIAFFERFKKNKNILTEFLEQHTQLEQEYENIIASTSNNMWELEYWENKKDYYENHYNHGTEQPEYQEVLKQIKKVGEKMKQHTIKRELKKND